MHGRVSGTTVAIVDDHPVFRVGMRRILERQAEVVVVWEAATAEEALRACEARPVDLVLMDVSLGRDLDGIQLTRSLRERHPEVQVVIMSALIEDTTVAAALAAGAAGYLGKDLQAEELVDSLRLLMHRSGSRTHGGVTRTPARKPPLTSSLSRRELEVVAGIVAGRTNREIANQLGIAETTVNKHVHHILRKLNARNRAHAAILFGQSHGQREALSQ